MTSCRKVILKMTELYNLKKVLEYFKISNNELAKGTDIDPSLISRYLSGQRQLKASSRQADSIAEYLMQMADSGDKIEWLNEQFRDSGMKVDMSSVFHMKDNIMTWISSDGDKMVRNTNFFETENDNPVSENKGNPYGTMVVGRDSIKAALNAAVSGLPDHIVLDMFLTSDRIKMLSDPDFVAFLQNEISEKKLNLNIVICVSGNTQSINKILSAYLKNIVDGTIRFYTFFGSAKTLAEQMYIIIGGEVAAIITETLMGASEPIGTFIENEVFVNEIYQSFNATYRYSQPMFNLYDDNYTRDMIEVLYAEYCLPGELCVIKDSINPMYMSFENYCRVLKQHNPRDGEYAWKCNEYRRFKDGFNNMMETGMSCLEIISYNRLKEIVREKNCKMAGLYFMQTGFFELDLQGCIDILTGYVEYLEKYPNFSLLILDNLPELHSCNCWHIKHNTSIAINDWNGAGPIMIHSNHNVVVQEFQTHYNTIWERGKGSMKNKAYIISVLKSVIGELKKELSDENQ